jgi:hypothetical protein
MTIDWIREGRDLGAVGAMDAEWEAAATMGPLQLQRCEACGQLRFPNGPVCPACWDADWSWVASAGTGEIWSWVTFHVRYWPERPAEVPYVVACVQLDEGPRVMSNLAGAVSGLAVGARVHAVTGPTFEGETRLIFELDA